MEAEILLIKGEIAGSYEGTRLEVDWNMQDDGLKILSRVKTNLFGQKARRFTILGLNYWFFFRDGKLFYKINSPEFNYYLNRLKNSEKRNVIYQGFQMFHLKQKNKWQSIHINTINYKNQQYELLMLIKY